MSKCYFTDGEIVAMYRDAKNKNEQIEILCELTLLSRSHIIAIIRANGYDLPKPKYERLKRGKWLPWTQDEIDTLRALVAANTTWEAVAAGLPERTYSAVVAFSLNHGLKLGRDMPFLGKVREVKWSEGRRETAFDLARDGATYAEIAEYFGRDIKTVRNMFGDARKRGEDVPRTMDGRRRSDDE